jgi:hypothetical protein
MEYRNHQIKTTCLNDHFSALRLKVLVNKFYCIILSSYLNLHSFSKLFKHKCKLFLRLAKNGYLKTCQISNTLYIWLLKLKWDERRFEYLSRVTIKPTCYSAFATSMDPDKPVHPRNLIRIHAVRLQTLKQVEKLKRTAWILIRLRGWFGSMLVANPLCWFCHGAAPISSIYFENDKTITYVCWAETLSKLVM